MTVIDILIIVLGLAGATIGWRKGLTGQLGALGGVLLAIILCRWFGSDLVEHFSSADDTVQTRLLHTVLVYFMLGVIAYVGVRVVAGFAGNVFRALRLTVVNRAAGAVFGAFEWLLGLSLLLNLWVGIFPDTQLRTKHSAVTEAVMDIAPVVLASETVQQVLSLKDIKRPDALTPGGEQPDSTATAVGKN